MASSPPPTVAASVTEHHSRLEPWIIAHLCQPVLARLPTSVAPNSISLATHAISWGAALAALASPSLSTLGRTIALLVAVLGTLAATITDCLDGMQARRTGRCSRLGEMLDHWLDTVHVPLLTLGMVSALGLDPWAVASVHIIGTVVFNAQLVLHQESGRFVHATTSGTEATFFAAVGYAALAVALLVADRSWRAVDITLQLAAALAVLLQVKLSFFYYRRLGRGVLRHLPFLLTTAGYAALYLLGAIARLPFLFAIVFVSFRISGTFVLSRILGRRYSGFDLGLVVAIVAIGASHWLGPRYGLGGLTVGGLRPPDALALASCVYMVGRNVWDFVRAFPSLRPGAVALEPTVRAAVDPGAARARSRSQS